MTLGTAHALFSEGDKVIRLQKLLDNKTFDLEKDFEGVIGLSQDSKNTLLVFGVLSGNKEFVKKIIPVSNPRHKQSLVLRLAVRSSDIELIKLLLPHSDPKDEQSEALVIASETGLLDVVRLLLPLSDAKKNKSCALRVATLHATQEIFDLLYPYSNPEEALKEMKRTREGLTDYLEQRVKHDRRRKEIEDCVRRETGDHHCQKPIKKL